MSNHRDVTSKNIFALVLIGVVASIVGIALGLWIDWFPAAASSQAGPIDELYTVLMVLCVIIFVGVTEMALFMIWKFRMRKGEEDLDGPNLHGSTKLEIIWTAIPAAVIAVLCVYAVNVLSEIDAAKADQVQVGVYGQQFAWQFEYKAPSGKKFLANELWLECTPTGSSITPGSPCTGPQVKFDIKAVDVIHSFWVPELRMKQDAVPGITTHTKVDPTRLGTYSVVCAELCGIGHGIMRAIVHVVPPAKYSAWLAKAASKS